MCWQQRHRIVSDNPPRCFVAAPSEDRCILAQQWPCCVSLAGVPMLLQSICFYSYSGLDQCSCAQCRLGVARCGERGDQGGVAVGYGV